MTIPPHLDHAKHVTPMSQLVKAQAAQTTQGALLQDQVYIKFTLGSYVHEAIKELVSLANANDNSKVYWTRFNGVKIWAEPGMQGQDLQDQWDKAEDDEWAIKRSPP